MHRKLINCDLGECLTPNLDVEIMPLIDIANIACGGHVGDDNSMLKAIQLAKYNQVKIGAHPSYADRQNFGRIPHQLSNQVLYNLLYQQITYFQKLCQDNTTMLEIIKPHGALYHDITHNPRIFNICCEVIQNINENLSLVVQAGFKKHTSINLLYEVFADRTYNGIQIIPRSEKNAVLDDAKAIVEQYQFFLTQSNFEIDTICFHGDNPASVEALKQIKNA